LPPERLQTGQKRLEHLLTVVGRDEGVGEEHQVVWKIEPGAEATEGGGVIGFVQPVESVRPKPQRSQEVVHGSASETSGALAVSGLARGRTELD
jgi:hypothetical protein